MKGTVFAVALNHSSQISFWHEAFNKEPYKTPPKTPIWFIKPRNTVINSGDVIPHPIGETVQSGATLALLIGKTARKVSVQNAEQYIAGYALANEVSLPETSFYRPAIKAKCRDGFCPIGQMIKTNSVESLDIVTEINGQEVDRWSTEDLVRSASELLAALSEFATLKAGDAILLGTPHQRITLHPADKVTVKAKGFPDLENSVVLAGGQA
ncbi:MULTISPECIES: fumarylacetoacetate hydrolase family protein [Xenorhabdus]|uniref:2-hydroxyhepta-2,4-diene-1,7-dioate isomerase n=1 Tax=Xenorhabdus ehlersii TaxID=290111 RepID=A0A2D0IKY8_9GAMM|nr:MULTISPECIES: fumarylacetoacetate hydrolase family protein [Xenorhabdus]MBC8948663.1 2-hydroxyhepta-2,4-diene-1,7-dioate isomerase [Xenorhabdus sp. TS4]PHM22442.1 2-hydroxyhepta-2,4-diene-1,7-dioate isomerase [Xenorhabdus ehlersii]RKE92990.1 5-carboxy-2-oxohept-3-enedioate decarboxylase HpaG1 subunit [Xenorhabdus ehlersii]